MIIKIKNVLILGVTMITVKTGIRLRSIVNSISNTVDLVNNNVTKHHQRVAYISYEIGRMLKLNHSSMLSLIMAAALHDIGALSSDQESSLLHSIIDENVEEHAKKGYLLLKDFKPLEQSALIIKYHHHQWNEGAGLLDKDTPIPYEGHIIHLADSVEILINKDLHILTQKDTIIETIKSQSGFMFDPETVDAFEKSFQADSPWLALDYISLKELLDNECDMQGYYELSYKELEEFSKIISYIIDFRSRYTASHSTGVASVASELGRLSGFDEKDCAYLRIAGYLHDLGKIAIPPEILDKECSLTESEYAVMRSHSYQTYRILNEISGMDIITKWASFHHERLDGSGYPFGLTADDIPKGARLIAVADVFSALIEERPYRRSLPLNEVCQIMTQMDSKLDKQILNILFDNINEIYRIREKSQEEALKDYCRINFKNARQRANEEVSALSED